MNPGQSIRRFLFSFLLSSSCSLCLCGESFSQEPCSSGPQAGQRCGPYAALIATGPERGQSYCYICETGDKPAVLIFAHTPTDSLGKLIAQLDKAVADHKKEELRAWVTFLSEDQLNLDPKLVKWSEKYAIRSVPLGIFEDPLGPPSYRLAKNADVTMLMFVKQKVVANVALRAGELNDEKIKEVMNALPRIIGEKK
jgi:hypothetical protein